MNEDKSLNSGDGVQSGDTLPTTAPVTCAEVEALTGLKRAKWQRFVMEYVRSGNRTAAAIAAGYAPRRADNAGYRLSHIPAIAEAVKAVRRALAERSRYTLDSLIAELDEAAEFARQTENAAALVRAREMKGKAMGLIVDRLDARVQAVPFRIAIGGIDDEVKS